MWKFKNLMGEEAVWYTEEEYIKLKEENEELKNLIKDLNGKRSLDLLEKYRRAINDL